MFFGLLDLDLLVRGTDLDPRIRIQIWILPFSLEAVERTEIMLAKLNFYTKFL
jgi:hypothetical protein